MIYEITVPGEPASKQRARVTKTGHSYTPEATVRAENWVKTCAVEQVGTPLIEGPVSMAITAVFSIPKSLPKKKRELALAGKIRPVGRIDVDNMAKLVMDSLHGILYLNDNVVVDLRVRKVYGLEPKVVITACGLDDF